MAGMLVHPTECDNAENAKALTQAGLCEADPSALEVTTPWGPLTVPDEARPSPFDPERHLRFQQLAIDAIRTHCPWMVAVLQVCGGKVLAFPGGCVLEFPGPVWIPVPSLAAHLSLVPWAEDGQTPQ